MRAVLSIALAFFSVASSLDAPTPANDIGSNGEGDDNSVFAAEEAMQHQFTLASKRARNKPTNAASGATSAGTSIQPKVVSGQEQRARVTELAMAEKTKVRTEIQQRRVAESEASRQRGPVSKEGAGLSAAALIRSKLGSKALEDFRLNSENSVAKGEVSAEARTVTMATVQSQLNLELRADAVVLNSSSVALQSQTRSLNATIASLHSEESRRAAAEKTSAVEALALKQTHAKISEDAVSLAAANATLTKTTAQLRTAVAQLRSATAANASETDQSVAELQAELQASRAESLDLKRKLGRVVKMVQSDLAAKDREASEALAAEHATGEKARAELAAGQREAEDLRARSAELASENHKLRVLAQARQ